MIELRGYQERDIERLRDEMRASRRVLYVAPTGSGKTVLFAAIARRAAAKGKRVVILVHRVELARQAAAKLAGLGIDAGLVTAAATTRLDAGVVVAALPTLDRRQLDLGAVDLVVVDEAHHAVAETWARVLARFEAARVLGVTATPERLDGCGLGAAFDAMVLGPEVEELMARGYLAPVRAYARLAAGEDLKSIRSRGGDYDRKQLGALMLKLPVTQAAVDDYLGIGEGRPAFAFCVGRTHNHAVVAAFVARGVPAASLDGSASDKEREAVLERFKAGTIKVLVSCDLLTEGFDAPEAAVAVLLRPTKSLALHRQMIGRVLRPKADGGAALLLDYSGNLLAHGLPDMPVAWSLAGRGGAKGELGARCRSCPTCGAVLALAALVCGECGREFRQPSARAITGTDPGALIEIGAEQFKGLPYWQAVKAARTLDDLKRIAAERGYPPAWVYVNARKRGIPIPRKGRTRATPAPSATSRAGGGLLARNRRA